MNCSLNVTPYRPYEKPKKSFKNVITETTKKLKGVVNSCFLRQHDFCLQSSSVWALGSRKEPVIPERFTPGGFTRTGMRQNTSKRLLSRLQPSAYTHPAPRLAKEFWNSQTTLWDNERFFHRGVAFHNCLIGESDFNFNFEKNQVVHSWTVDSW